ncbi:hypothetical protein BDV11DRAFT_172997 [Aspergillus similis]
MGHSRLRTKSECLTAEVVGEMPSLLASAVVGSIFILIASTSKPLSREKHNYPKLEPSVFEFQADLELVYHMLNVPPCARASNSYKSHLMEYHSQLVDMILRPKRQVGCSGQFGIQQVRALRSILKH